MKNLKISILFILAFGLIQAQKIIEKNIDYKNQYIELDVKFANKIEVKTWDKATVYFKADIYTKSGNYLDLYELDIDTNSSSISIESNAEPVLKKSWTDYRKNHSGKRKNYYYSDEDPEYRFNYILYVPKNAKFRVSSINGSLKSEIIQGEFTADLINGDIEITKYSGDLDLKTINGAIDLKMINANLVAETIHGDIFADQKLKFNSSSRHVGQIIKGSIGNAKNKLRLNTINGNMYLRL